MRALNTSPCPKCQHLVNDVIQTNVLPGGERVRRRRCNGCEHSWYTEQPPERRIVDTTRLIWRRGMVVGLGPPAESTENQKI